MYEISTHEPIAFFKAEILYLDPAVLSDQSADRDFCILRRVCGTWKMKTPKTALLCISDTYLPRARMLASFYSSNGDETRIYTPDFSHKSKSAITEREEGVVYLHHRPYTSNLSWQRLLGHMEFARLVRRELEEWEPNRIHCLVPANALASQSADYKKSHPQTELILDINDLWPESLPMGWAVHTPPAWYWKSLRTRSLDVADRIFTECQLFADEIKKQSGRESTVLYWSASTDSTPHPSSPDPEFLDLCYLGFVNNIIDLDALEDLFERLARIRPVRLHLIAQGARRPEMADRLGRHATIVDHGTIYDPAKRQQILDVCSFGLNIMKKGVQAGLSMKTLDYLQGALPVINSLAGDVWQWIEQDGCGINYDRNDPQKTAEAVANMNPKQLMEAKGKARAVYERYLSPDAFYAVLEQTIQK